MSTELRNIYLKKESQIPSGIKKRIAIVVSEWNEDITIAMLKSAKETLLKNGVKESDILVEYVPGSFELTFAAKSIIKKGNIDSVIVLGSVIQGDTPHFTFVCNSVTDGITKLNTQYDIPVVFGLLTTNNLEQAKDRSGVKLGNKGEECAITALKMIEISDRYK